jgi:hypothetical protein
LGQHCGGGGRVIKQFPDGRCWIEMGGHEMLLLLRQQQNSGNQVSGGNLWENKNR